MPKRKSGTPRKVLSDSSMDIVDEDQDSVSKSSPAAGVSKHDSVGDDSDSDKMKQEKEKAGEIEVQPIPMELVSPKPDASIVQPIPVELVSLPETTEQNPIIWKKRGRPRKKQKSADKRPSNKVPKKIVDGSRKSELELKRLGFESKTELQGKRPVKSPQRLDTVTSYDSSLAKKKKMKKLNKVAKWTLGQKRELLQALNKLRLIFLK